MFTLLTRRAGPFVMQTLYPSFHKSDTPERRREKSAMRSKANRAKNLRAQWKILLLYLAFNFTPAETTLTLTFSDAFLPKGKNDREQRKEVRRMMEYYLRKLRKLLPKWCGKHLKYIYVIESKHGEGRYHVHMVSNIPIRYMKAVLALWPYGTYTNQEMDVLPLDANHNVAWAAVAHYLAKEGVEDRDLGCFLWHKSRNVIFPPETREQVEDTYTLKDHLPTWAFIVERSSFERPTGGGRYEYIWYARADNST